MMPSREIWGFACEATALQDWRPNRLGNMKKYGGYDDWRRGSKRRLMWHGMFLFLLGLLTGLVEQHFSNPRMGLAAHLEGVMNGTFLVALGAIWVEVRLSASLKTGAYWTALYGTYVNWAVTTLAAVFGAASLSPITGAGYSALPWQETVVTVGFMTVGVTTIAASVLALWGLRRTAVS